ncbi:thiamine diphosphokinase [Enterococcus asini]|uniref:thiamine diphosphokinase n=1 Tax=Enterococcus asini TaxID=57732 RepID=UPI00288F862F|nr:thiamine diphosphokinase [Enterococcus asini]MDT2757561.1 thiamine diphosphokinase [Enterococcus asini]
MKTLLVAGGSPDFWPVFGEFERYVGIDRGALYLLERNLPLDLAVGDFDSLNEAERQRVFTGAKAVQRSVPEKDDTDTQLALSQVFAEDPTAQVTLIGATGGRLDHLLANLWLALEPRFQPYLRQIRLEDSQNSLVYYGPGTHEVQREVGMKYLAYCCLTPIPDLTLTESKYLLHKQKVQVPTSYASNEFVTEKAGFSFSEGVIALIQSRD